MKTISRFNDDVTVELVDNISHYEINVIHNETGSARGIEMSDEEMDLLLSAIFEHLEEMQTNKEIN